MALVLAKALAHGDFHSCAYLLTAALRSDAGIAPLFALADALEAADFKLFWKLLDERPVPGLPERARKTILRCERWGASIGRKLTWRGQVGSTDLPAHFLGGSGGDDARRTWSRARGARGLYAGLGGAG